MLRQLPPSHANGQSMEMYSSGKKHVPSVVIVSLQRSEHGNLSLKYDSCFVSCHLLITTVRAWLYIIHVWNMLRQLSSPHDNIHSMVVNPLGMKHAPSVVIISWQWSEIDDTPLSMSHALSVAIVSWQRSEHGYLSLRYETCFVGCRLMTTVWVWLYIPQVWNMLHQLSSSHENGQSMVIYPSSMNNALSVDIVSWQRSGHGYISIKYETCSVSCHRLMTTDRAWLFIPKV